MSKLLKYDIKHIETYETYLKAPTLQTAMEKPPAASERFRFECHPEIHLPLWDFHHIQDIPRPIIGETVPVPYVGLTDVTSFSIG